MGGGPADAPAVSAFFRSLRPWQPVSTTPAQCADHIKKETVNWTTLLRQSNVEPQ
jgi:hypothetical protein